MINYRKADEYADEVDKECDQLELLTRSEVTRWVVLVRLLTLIVRNLVLILIKLDALVDRDGKHR